MVCAEAGVVGSNVDPQNTAGRALGIASISPSTRGSVIGEIDALDHFLAKLDDESHSALLIGGQRCLGACWIPFVQSVVALDQAAISEMEGIDFLCLQPPDGDGFRAVPASRVGH